MIGTLGTNEIVCYMGVGSRDTRLERDDSERFGENVGPRKARQHCNDCPRRDGYRWSRRDVKIETIECNTDFLTNPNLIQTPTMSSRLSGLTAQHPVTISIRAVSFRTASGRSGLSPLTILDMIVESETLSPNGLFPPLYI